MKTRILTMSSKKALLAAGTMIALVGVSQGAIVEMWDFESGTVGLGINEDPNNGSFGWTYSAVGVNGTRMFGHQWWNPVVGPTYQTSTVPNGAGGDVMMNVDSGQRGYADFAGEAIQSMGNYDNWSMELNVNFDSVSAWRTMVGRNRSVANSGAEADLYFQINDAGTLRLNYRDNDGIRHVVDGNTTISAGSWYGLAASVSADDGTISLFVDDGTGYILDGQLTGAELQGADLAILDSSSAFTFGYGEYNGNAGDFSDAKYDNIAFHDEAVDFTVSTVSVSAIPEPSGVLALGLLFSASMLTRRR